MPIGCRGEKACVRSMYLADANVESYTRQRARSSPATARAVVATSPNVIAQAIVLRTLNPMTVFPRRAAATPGGGWPMLKHGA